VTAMREFGGLWVRSTLTKMGGWNTRNRLRGGHRREEGETSVLRLGGEEMKGVSREYTRVKIQDSTIGSTKIMEPASLGTSAGGREVTGRGGGKHTSVRLREKSLSVGEGPVYFKKKEGTAEVARTGN